MKNPVVIFRVSNSCNLNCKYCYDRNNHRGIKNENEEFYKRVEDIVKYLNEIFVDKTRKCKIIFHGGEPLIIKGEIYDFLIKKILEDIPKASFSIQTNGTLLSKKHIETFKRYNVRIGISLDGHNSEQNYCRVYKNGVNTFNKVMEKIELLRDLNVDYGVIMTVSKKIIGHEQELYDFIYKNKIKCNIRPAYPSENINDFYMTNEEYYTFFKNIFEIWIKDESKVKLTQIRELYEQFIKVLEPNCKIGDCATSGNCFGNFISLDIYGNIYSCNRTYNNPNFYYGNLNDIKIDRIMEKAKKLNNIRKEYLNNSKCKKCEIFEECRGGCPASAFSYHKKLESSDDYFCKAKKSIKKYLNDKIKELGLIEEYKNGKELEKNKNERNKEDFR